jgi:hypothetical protein
MSQLPRYFRYCPAAFCALPNLSRIVKDDILILREGSDSLVWAVSAAVGEMHRMFQSHLDVRKIHRSRGIKTFMRICQIFLSRDRFPPVNEISKPTNSSMVVYHRHQIL